MKAPFPYFGGKSKAAAVVWQMFGDVDNYVEPFAGSLAVLLGRPEDHERKIETVNDVDNYIVNFWRALQADPEAVARWADYPVTETDLTARHLWLVTEGRERIANLDADPGAYDAQVAGWWVWGICIWIGRDWCSGAGPWVVEGGQLVKRTVGDGVSARRPNLGYQKGIHRKRIHLQSYKGISRQLPHLGMGGEMGINHTSVTDLSVYMHTLADRLRRVRVCCGDWQRVVTPGATSHGATVGIFLDPPYAQDIGRDPNIYNHETGVSVEVREWAVANGDNPRYRIALCGYEGEHDMPRSWSVYSWLAGGAYATANSARKNLNNRRERIWFSPGCSNGPLFEALS